MTDYEIVLLAAVADECPMGFRWYVVDPQAEEFVYYARDQIGHVGMGDSLADALTALLRDLGADVPEWPSDGRVASILSQPRSLDYLWHLPLPEYLALRGGS